MIENLILQGLVESEEYSRIVLSHIKPEYFKDDSEKEVFKCISDYMVKYNRLPQRSVLLVNIAEANVSDSIIDVSKDIINSIFSNEKINNEDWLLSETEIWCQERAMYRAIQTSISIYTGTEKKLSSHSIPDMMRDALKVSFKVNIRAGLV